MQRRPPIVNQVCNALPPTCSNCGSNCRGVSFSLHWALAHLPAYAKFRKLGLAQLVLLLACVSQGPRASAQLPDPNQGPGGPILVVTSVSPYGKYYAEILRTEGLNEFAVLDIGAVTPAALTSYDVVILAPAALTAPQVTLFSNWVNAGGNLIAMRPDPQLDSLLGISSLGSTLSNAYLRVNTATPPGNGIVSQSMQFHGVANTWSLNGASSLATLYTNPTTATSNPAVTLRSVGSNGGQAAAFAWDLATSIVHMRQGNPAWATQERDGLSPIRSDDKFYGAATGDPAPDWVDLDTLVSIPQADEQQRLLANLILHMNLAKKPLPRFWYFPRGKKAVVIMTGDDHANGGTAGRFDQYIAASPAGCNVANWECVRATSYMFVQPQNLSSAQADTYNSQGFEVGLHINTDCADFTPASLNTFYGQQVANFSNVYGSVVAPVTQRHHCIAWSDWVTSAKTQLTFGMRLDTTYYYWPPAWAQNRPGHFTGSAMPMRFADLDGTMINVYNAPTQMTDESGQAYPFTSDALLSAAVGPQGFYGVYTVNAHTDAVTNPVSDAVVSSALARGVPVVSSAQMLRWLDARNSSSFSALAWSGTALSFTITPGSGANGLQAMLPLQSSSGVLTGITGPGGAVPFTADTIKGVHYALFPAAAGAYTASWVADTTPPTVTATSPVNGATGVTQGATVTAAFSEALDPATVNAATVVLRNAANAIVPATVAWTAATNTARLTPNNSLAPSASYTATLTTGIRDLSGNALAASNTWSFTTAAGPSCPCTAFSSSAAPATPSVNDPNPVELGVKFRVALDGFISGIRFYKGAANTGSHVGRLWSTAGQQLATATFTSETASGWQQVNFPNPIAVTANTIYVASYHTSVGNYAATNGGFASAGVDNSPVHLLQDGVSGGNGVYAYSVSSTFPAETFQSSNYWVDVVFNTNAGSTPLSVLSTTPASGATGVSPGTTVGATFSSNLNPATVGSSTFTLRDPGNTLVTGSYAVTGATATFTPGSSLAALTTYTATVTTGITDGNGNALPANYTWSFTTAAAAGGCGAPPNAIVAENCLTGNPASEWDISGAGDASIQGFATDISVNQGGTVNFKISTNAAAYRLDIYRMGYYGGSGARKVDTIARPGPQNQPACLTTAATGLIDCGNWTTSASWTIPAGAVSGIYFARAVRTDTGGASHIFFIVRNDSSNSDMLFQTADTTWQAYNSYGGNSLYTGAPAGRAYKVSYNRPFNTRAASPEDWVFNSEYPMVRWLEANGYDVTYTTGIDTDRLGNLLLNHKIFLSVGHDEYWSSTQRANVEAARAAGVHLAFLSGNEVFWKTRWENSIAAPADPYRTLVCYKETHANAKIDPSPEWTGTWRDPRFSPPANGGRPENALTGTIFTVNCCTSGIQMTVSAEAGKMRFWRNTNIATLAPGTSTTFGNTGILNYEWDEDLNNGFRPANLIRLSGTPVSGVSYLQDFGSTYASGNATHTFTLYRHGSGAFVFGAGTPQYSWGLDNNHDRGLFPVDVRLQQATVNLFADMSVQPRTLQAGLTPAAASADTNAPVSTITAPSAGSNVPVGGTVTITGTAADTGGGVVAAVEVSVDSGTTWQSATGRATWSFAWIPAASGSVTIRSRAVDDSGNVETPGAGVTVTVGGGGTACTVNCTIWPSTVVPGTPDQGPDSAVELGVKFRSDVNGVITGIRFYKASANIGTHVGNLWSGTGQLLASATFSGETASGWQQVNFATPVSITANTVYVASYHTNVGHYSQDLGYFATTGVDNPPLHALRDGISGFNGAYSYGAGSVFPSQGFNSVNYWVDVVFRSGAPPALTSIAVTPSNPSIPAGTTQQFTATGTYADSSTQNITAQVTWGSSNAAAATINSTGLATGVAAGASTISAVQGSITGTTTLTVQPAVLSITTTSLPAGTVGVSYSATLAANGGTGPYTWSVITGSLPVGLSMSATGVISGTPAAAGTSAFTVQVRDAATPAATATRSLSIVIAAAIVSTSYFAPTAHAPVTILAGDNNGFETSPANAFALDGLLAVDANSGTNNNTSCTNAGKDKHVYLNHNVILPAGVAIRGIEVRLGASVSSIANAPKMCVQLSSNGGVTWTAALSTATLTTTTATYTLGGTANLWGRAWTAADFANGGFRVRIINVAGSSARTFSLDGAAVRVTYQ